MELSLDAAFGRASLGLRVLLIDANDVSTGGVKVYAQKLRGTPAIAPLKGIENVRMLFDNDIVVLEFLLELPKTEVQFAED